MVSSPRGRAKQTWSIQGAPIFEEAYATISEHPEYTYLGILTSDNEDPFHLQQQKITKKLAIDAKILPTLFQWAPGRIRIQDLVWRQVALAGCLYGAEVLVPSKETIEDLEKIQRIVGRRILHDRKKSANEGVLGELGWLPIMYKFHERNLNFRVRLHRLPEDRLAKQILSYTLDVEKPSKWLAYSNSLLDMYQVDVEGLAKKTNAASKNEIHRLVLKVFEKQWFTNEPEQYVGKKGDMKGKQTMRFMLSTDPPLHIAPYLDGTLMAIWYHRARTDGVPLNSRVFPRNNILCPYLIYNRFI